MRQYHRWIGRSSFIEGFSGKRSKFPELDGSECCQYPFDD